MPDAKIGPIGTRFPMGRFFTKGIKAHENVEGASKRALPPRLHDRHVRSGKRLHGLHRDNEPRLFPEGDSPDRHLEGSGGDSKQRNPNIAQVLFRSGMIEQYGTGISAASRGRATPLAWHSATARTSTQP